VAPLAATVAATLAVGVGFALARSERERRGTRQRKPDRRLGLAAGEPVAGALRRMAVGQAELAIEMLAGSDGAPPDEKAVHETRKALKRLRALLRLLRHELGDGTFARENVVLRDTGRRLSGARDAEVMVATLDSLIDRHPRTLGRRRGVRELRARVLAEQARVQQLTFGDPATPVAALGELHAFRHRVERWSLAEHAGIGLIERDLERLYRQGRKRWARAVAGKGKEMLAMHEWRKRVKDLRYIAEMLQRRQHGGALARVAAGADDLGEVLGEDHDLAVLAEHLRAGARWDGPDTWRTGRRTREALLEAIAKRRRKLRRRALRDGRKLYRQKPKRFVRRVRNAHRRGATGRFP
jgi:CHAD domain-containing protein